MICAAFSPETKRRFPGYSRQRQLVCPLPPPDLGPYVLTQRFTDRLLLFLTLLAPAWAGCAAFTVPEAPPRPTPAQPVWLQPELEQHLRFFNGGEDGRLTGTQGYARIAAYVAARLTEFGLQPALDGEFRVVYKTPLNHILTGALATMGADTTVFVPGLDFIPDGRSDSGSVLVNEVVAVGADFFADSTAIAWPSGRGVLLAPEYATPGHLHRLREAGVSAVFVPGSLTAVQAAHPIQGMLVFRLTPEAAAQITGLPVQTLSAQYTGRVYVLPRPLRPRVAADYQAQAGAINMLGYVPGGNPAWSDELVIVCADLDAATRFAGLRALDFDHFGIGAAALLEAARNYAYFARYAPLPDRTMLFAFWSGARSGNLGLHAYLKQPLWPLDKTRALVYVGLSDEEAPAVRALLDAHGIPLYIAPPPEKPLFARRAVLFPDLSVRRRPQDRALKPEAPDLDLIYDAAVQASTAIAGEAHEMFLPLVVTPVPIFPFVQDTVYVPAGITP